MNLFVLDMDPIVAARYHCDKHVGKMAVEAFQQLASAAMRNGALECQLPITKAGTPAKGGYQNHPCTIWCGDSRINYMWASAYGEALCYQFRKRYGKQHFCQKGIEKLSKLDYLLPIRTLTPFALAMPDEFKSSCAVKSYRDYYHTKKFAKWDRGVEAPHWFKLERDQDEDNSK